MGRIFLFDTGIGRTERVNLWRRCAPKLVDAREGVVVDRERGGEPWNAKAACRGPQSVLFFPPAHLERREEKADRERQAKLICRSCVVRRPCLEYALEIREQHGIWGGLNEVERRALLDSRAG